MITVNNLSKGLQSFKLKDISFDLPKGYIMGLIGENGAGKTTLLRILAGLYSFDEGSMKINDYELVAGDEYSGDIREHLGMVFQDEVFDLNSSLDSNSKRYGRFYKNHDGKLLAEYMGRFGLQGDKKYKRCSKGEKLKYALAFALSNKPGILLLDEPSGNFDREFRDEFRNVLREFTASGENSVILSTHITGDVEMFADYVLYLSKGEMVLFDDIESIRASYRMVAAEKYKIKLLKDRVIYMKENEFGCTALIKNGRKPLEACYKTWEPTVTELMYYMSKGKFRM